MSEKPLSDHDFMAQWNDEIYGQVRENNKLREQIAALKAENAALKEKLGEACELIDQAITNEDGLDGVVGQQFISSCHKLLGVDLPPAPEEEKL